MDVDEGSAVGNRNVTFECIFCPGKSYERWETAKRHMRHRHAELANNIEVKITLESHISDNIGKDLGMSHLCGDCNKICGSSNFE